MGPIAPQKCYLGIRTSGATKEKPTRSNESVNQRSIVSFMGCRDIGLGQGLILRSVRSRHLGLGFVRIGMLRRMGETEEHLWNSEVIQRRFALKGQLGRVPSQDETSLRNVGTFL